MRDLLEELETGVVPGDGAMGTALLEAGVSQCLEEACVSRPEIVRAIHGQYIEAGARLIRTNTFGANAARLARFGCENRVNEINWSAAQLAKDCARGKPVYVAGSVGPLGVPPSGSLFKEQIGALLDGGVDLIFLETFTDIDELALALYVKQSLHHCPVVCSLAGGAADKARLPGADILGFNCVGVDAMLQLFEKNAGFVSAFPNAGYPATTTPEEFARGARELVSHGARLVGGCCGIGPRHIAAMVDALGVLAGSN